MILEHTDYPALERLAQFQQWVGWKSVMRSGKMTKVPINPNTGAGASVTNPSTWSDFETAEDRVRNNNLQGMGFVFTDEDPFVGIDLDKCRDHEGCLEPWAVTIVEALESYTEVSPSGRGVHIIVEAESPGSRRRIGNLEIYAHKRFFTMTGEHLSGTPTEIEKRSTQLANIYALNTKGTSAERKQTVSSHEPELAKLTKEIEGHIDEDGEPPFEKFEALCKNAPIVEATWNRENKGSENWSPSEWDLSLANYFLNAGWSHEEIVSGLVGHRRKHGSDLKLRPDYYARTIMAAYRNRERDEAIDSLADEELQEVPVAERREHMLKALSVTLKLPVIDIVKYESDPPMWQIVSENANINLKIDDILSFRKFKLAVARDISQVTETFTNKTWDAIAQKLLSAARPIELGEEATEVGQMRSWLVLYIESKPTASHTYDPMSVAKGLPFKNDHQLYIVTSDFKDWIWRRQGQNISVPVLSRLLKQLGCNNGNRSITLPDGTWTSRGVWGLPKDIIEIIERQTADG